MKGTEQNIQELWDNIQMCNIENWDTRMRRKRMGQKKCLN